MWLSCTAALQRCAPLSVQRCCGFSACADAPEAQLKVPKVHHSTVALVPPDDAWTTIQNARRSLGDRGLFRWPPHINLLYPFVPPDRYPDALPRISAALRNIEPFELSLDALGCFGGRQRGVLYVYASAPESLARLRQLQGALEAAMPMCDDQRKAGGGNEFVPHMTICHYASRAEAEEAKAQLEASAEWRPTTFRVADAAVHVMLRQGDSGQFERCATVALGCGAAEAQLLDPPARFVGMPLEEEAWVREARMEAKKARYGPRGGGRRGGRRRSPRRSPEEREEVRNRSPEQIAEIRRQRAAKKERARLLES